MLVNVCKIILIISSFSFLLQLHQVIRNQEAAPVVVSFIFDFAMQSTQ